MSNYLSGYQLLASLYFLDNPLHNANMAYCRKSYSKTLSSEDQAWCVEVIFDVICTFNKLNDQVSLCTHESLIKRLVPGFYTGYWAKEVK